VEVRHGLERGSMGAARDHPGDRVVVADHDDLLATVFEPVEDLLEVARQLRGAHPRHSSISVYMIIMHDMILRAPRLAAGAALPIAGTVGRFPHPPGRGSPAAPPALTGAG
jgi:hypothetical protein